MVTGQIPYDVICASPKMPTDLVKKLRTALLRLNPKRDLGRKVVGDTFRIDGFVEPRMDDYKEIETAARSAGLIK